MENYPMHNTLRIVCVAAAVVTAACSHARAAADAAEYRHGVSFTISHGTNYKESGKACNIAKQGWTVRLWGEPREGWCLIVHWAEIPNKPDLWMAVWKRWVDCKDLIPIAH
jgi:hypothetical protein